MARDMDTISTRWSSAMGLDVPIVNAPMGGAAGGVLAAAVSNAGALGLIGNGSSSSAASLATQLQILGPLDRPFGIGLIDWVVRRDPQILDTALNARPALLSVSFGVDYDWVARAHDAGCMSATQVADVDSALRAVDTLNTRVFDAALGYPWPARFPERVLRNDFTDAWDGRTPDDDARAQLRAAIAADDYRIAPVNAGQGVDDVTAGEPAADVIARLCADARARLATPPPAS